VRGPPSQKTLLVPASSGLTSWATGDLLRGIEAISPRAADWISAASFAIGNSGPVHSVGPAYRENLWLRGASFLVTDPAVGGVCVVVT
jgi:hypothetical protein